MLKTISMIIIFLPLLASFFSGILFKNKNKFSKIITTASVFISFILTFVLYKKISFSGEVIVIPLMKWISYQEFSFDIKIMIDQLTTTMSFVVTFI